MVYIGTREYKYGRMTMSHMAADTLEELHRMAENIGVHRRHFQDKEGKPHYDVCKQMKQKVLGLGAKPVDDRELIRLFEFQNWKQSLIQVTKDQLEIAGIHREFKINEANARTCFDSGMQPWQVFREEFTL